MDKTDWKAVAEIALNALTAEFENKFNDLYQRGVIQCDEERIEDVRDEWVDRQFHEYTALDNEWYDKWSHGELNEED